MDQIAWILWLVLGVGLIVAEIFTLGFVLFWFGIGAIAAALTGYLGAGVGGQFLVFAIVSIALTAMSRTIFAKYLPHNDSNNMKMGMKPLAVNISGPLPRAARGHYRRLRSKFTGSTWTIRQEA